MLGLDSGNNKTLGESHGDGVIAPAPDTALSEIERAVVKVVLGALLRRQHAEVGTPESPLPGTIYRCGVCRLELVLDSDTGQMTTAPCQQTSATTSRPRIPDNGNPHLEPPDCDGLLDNGL